MVLSWLLLRKKSAMGPARRQCKASYVESLTSWLPKVTPVTHSIFLQFPMHIYPGNAHAFMNRSPEGVARRKSMGMPDEDDTAVELAWSRFRSWMSRFLSQ
ncbi:Dienelactone hydrolase [Dillenia turbinata]|uniref:Dienelactone hydrolase n=1 Tax=Dillenia turbinata TaxID=194707 RepID=A0AAN8UL30_9MAGN